MTKREFPREEDAIAHMRETYARRARNMRDAVGELSWTQADIAALLGINTRNLRNYVAGRRTITEGFAREMECKFELPFGELDK